MKNEIYHDSEHSEEHSEYHSWDIHDTSFPSLPGDRSGWTHVTSSNISLMELDEPNQPVVNDPESSKENVKVRRKRKERV